MAYMDVTQSHSYCENVSGKTISSFEIYWDFLFLILLFIFLDLKEYLNYLKIFFQKEFFPSNSI